MFTRRQAIRWAELWLSCWNEGDFDTLLALYRDTTRFGAVGRTASPPHLTTARSRHSSVTGRRCRLAFTPFAAIWSACRGIPETRELTIVYATDLGGTRLYGCDLVTLDTDGRVVLGEPCVGCVADDEPRRARRAGSRRETQCGRRTVMRIMAARTAGSRLRRRGRRQRGHRVDEQDRRRRRSARRRRRIRCGVRSSGCRTTACSTSWRSGSIAAP